MADELFIIIEQQCNIKFDLPATLLTIYKTTAEVLSEIECDLILDTNYWQQNRVIIDFDCGTIMLDKIIVSKSPKAMKYSDRLLIEKAFIIPESNIKVRKKLKSI